MTMPTSTRHLFPGRAWCALILFGLFSCAASAAAPAASSAGWSGRARILSRIAPPTFPARDFVITSYGAKGDGMTDCTEAFRSAIDACAYSGGGRVIVPEGAWSTGAIHLR